MTTWEHIPEDMTRERLEKVLCESLEKFAERVENAARISWRFARDHPDTRDNLIRSARNLGSFAKELREFGKANP